jgi:hypothetical protein
MWAHIGLSLAICHNGPARVRYHLDLLRCSRNRHEMEKKPLRQVSHTYFLPLEDPHALPPNNSNCVFAGIVSFCKPISLS